MTHKQKGWLIVVMIILVTILTGWGCLSHAANVTLRWDPNDPTPDGYRIFMRQRGQSYNYSQPAWQGTATTCTITTLQDEVTYYFVVRAFMSDPPLESADSIEISYNTLVGGMDTVKNPRFQETP
jgi:hypothetical protein